METRPNMVHDNRLHMGETSAATSSVNVRAVCPFSSATLPPPSSVVDVIQPVDVVEEMAKGGGCPAHALVPAIPIEKKSKGGGCPAHALVPAVPVEEKSKGGGCPAHALVPAIPVEEKAKGGGCPAHIATNPVDAIIHAATPITTKEDDTLPIQQGVEKKAKGGGCPAHKATNANAVVPGK